MGGDGGQEVCTQTGRRDACCEDYFVIDVGRECGGEGSAGWGGAGGRHRDLGVWWVYGPLWCYFKILALGILVMVSMPAILEEDDSLEPDVTERGVTDLESRKK